MMKTPGLHKQFILVGAERVVNERTGRNFETEASVKLRIPLEGVEPSASFYSELWFPKKGLEISGGGFKVQGWVLKLKAKELKQKGIAGRIKKVRYHPSQY